MEEHTDRLTYSRTDILLEGHTDRLTDIRTDIQLEGHTDRWMEKFGQLSIWLNKK